MKVYSWNVDTLEFFGAMDAPIDPEESRKNGVPVYLAGPWTQIETGDIPAGYWPVWNGVGWKMVEDHRGETMYKTTDKSVYMCSNLGPIPAGYTTSVPGSEYDDWTGSAWVLNAEKKAAAEAAEAAKTANLAALTNLQSELIVEVKAKYGLDIIATDTVASVAVKMIGAGVSWADVDIYGGRLKLINDAIKELVG